MIKQALTPPMGWNAWNYFGRDGITETIMQQTAQAMADLGFVEAGYRYVNVDDCWMLPQLAADGGLVPDPERFPHGLKALGDYLHARGLLFGLYAGAGVLTFGGGAGSFGYERQHARQFAEWGVDLLKYDFGYVAPGNDPSHLFRRMGQALRESGRDIVFSGCIADDTVAQWMRPTGASLWRVANDLTDEWESILRVARRSLERNAYAGPDGWNDPDMLVVGLNGQGHHGHLGAGCTRAEYETHFALWCMLAAPLIMGHDVRATTPETAAILLNKELIAIDQDPLGVAAYELPTLSNHDWILAKPLANGDVALCAVNESQQTKNMIFSWDYCGWDLHDRVRARDVLRQEDAGEFVCGAAVEVEPHACCVWRLTRV